MTITIRRQHLEGCEHEYPDDWTFGGANGGDPRADPRWMPTTYQFLDRNFRTIFTCSSALCDHIAAQEQRERVDGYFPHTKVYYVKAVRQNGDVEIVYQDVEGALGSAS